MLEWNEITDLDEPEGWFRMTALLSEAGLSHGTTGSQRWNKSDTPLVQKLASACRDGEPRAFLLCVRGI